MPPIVRLAIACTLSSLAGCAAAPVPVAPSPAPVVVSVAPSPGASPAVPTDDEGASAANSQKVPEGAFLFYEDFEHGTDRWDIPAVAPDAVAWRLLHAHSCTGEYTMLLGRDQQAAFTGPAADSVFTLKDGLDLSKGVKPMLKYDLKGLALPYDAIAFQPEVQPPGGAWQPLGQPVQADHNFALTYTDDLSAWAGKRLGLRFRVTVKATDKPTSGIYLDEIAVLEPRG